MNGPRQKFCEGIVSGLTATDAYRAAYPRSTDTNARKHAPRLASNGDINAEIARLRALAAEQAGGAVMTLVRMRLALAAVAESKTGILNGSKILTSDRIAAIKLDAALAGIGKEAEAIGSEADANDALAGLLERCMK